MAINIEWNGKGVDEVAIDTETNKIVVSINPRYYRPTEVELLIGDPSKAKTVLGWEAKTPLNDLVKIFNYSNFPEKGPEGLSGQWIW